MVSNMTGAPSMAEFSFIVQGGGVGQTLIVLNFGLSLAVHQVPEQLECRPLNQPQDFFYLHFVASFSDFTAQGP